MELFQGESHYNFKAQGLMAIGVSEKFLLHPGRGSKCSLKVT